MKNMLVDARSCDCTEAKVVLFHPRYTYRQIANNLLRHLEQVTLVARHKEKPRSVQNLKCSNCLTDMLHTNILITLADLIV